MESNPPSDLLRVNESLQWLVTIAQQGNKLESFLPTPWAFRFFTGGGPEYEYLQFQEAGLMLLSIIMGIIGSLVVFVSNPQEYRKLPKNFCMFLGVGLGTSWLTSVLVSHFYPYC
jgi:hypothetical protein